MSSGPILALVLAREKAIVSWRELIGPTSTDKARTTHPDRQVFQEYKTQLEMMHVYTMVHGPIQY